MERKGGREGKEEEKREEGKKGITYNWTLVEAGGGRKKEGRQESTREMKKIGYDGKKRKEKRKKEENGQRGER